MSRGKRVVKTNTVSKRRPGTWKQKLFNTAKDVAAYGLRNYLLERTRSVSPTPSPKYMTRLVSTRPIGGRRRKSTRKKVKSFVPKVKNTKFTKKVRKVIQSNLPFGDSTVIQYQQLRQVDIDRYRYYTTCERFFGFVCGNVNDLMNHTSMLWNGKTLQSDWNNTTGNFSNQTKLNIKSYYVDIFLKSTSSHVVNVEIYECTAKTNTGDTVLDSIADQPNNMIWRVNDGNSYTGVEANGLRMSNFTEMLQQWDVKVHRVKLSPGDHTTLTFKIMGNRTVDCSKYLDNGTAIYAHRGVKDFFFKVINDPTVSAVTGNIHQWFSSSIGGVALKFTRHVRMQCPEVVAEANQKNAMVCYNGISATATSQDQQVVVQNPLTTTSFGG